MRRPMGRVDHVRHSSDPDLGCYVTIEWVGDWPRDEIEQLISRDGREYQSRVLIISTTRIRTGQESTVEILKMESFQDDPGSGYDEAEQMPASWMRLYKYHLRQIIQSAYDIDDDEAECPRAQVVKLTFPED